jgi:cytidylate kinase
MLNKAKNAKIAISGRSGCGNSTVSRLVAEKLGLRLINYTFHDLAKDMNIPFTELYKLVEKDSCYDVELDKKLVDLTREPGCVLGSRLAIWLLKQADLKVYLTASPEVRARRIASREGQSFEQAYKDMMERDKKDTERYVKLYGIDNTRYDFADLVINTDNIDQYGVVAEILEALRKKLM